MFTCVICRFGVPFDDTVVSGRNGRCVCLRCYVRETGTVLSMTPELRKDLSHALGGIAGNE